MNKLLSSDRVLPKMVAGCLFAFCLAFTVPPARAENNPETNEKMALAREEFAAGLDLYKIEDFEGALESYHRSLKAFPHFRTIFNIALCWEKLGRIPEAIEMYSRYVDWPTDVPNRDEVTEKLDTLKALIQVNDPSEEKTSDIETEEKSDELSEDGDVTRAESDVAIQGGIVADVPDGEENKGKKVAGWVMTGVGLGSVAAGAVCYGLAVGKKNKAEASETVQLQLDSDMKKLEKAGYIVGGIGLAAVGVGIVLLVVGKSEKRKENKLSMGFSPMDGGALAVIGGRF